jgi:hypothetical protein
VAVVVDQIITIKRKQLNEQVKAVWVEAVVVVTVIELMVMTLLLIQARF